MKKQTIIFIPVFLFFLLQTQAQESALWTSGRPDGHAPIGVMGDHTHGQGEFMLSYRYMYMNMEDMRNETDRLSQQTVLDDYFVTPLRMPMNMHMFGAMYAFSDRLTLMAMVNILDVSMDHVTRTGGMFTTSSGGIGDTRISGLLKLMDSRRQIIHLNLGVSIPTGSIDEMDVTPASAPNEAQLPYPMQIGSGTFDFMPGITYLAQGKTLSFGAQALATFRLGENDRSYALGNQLNLTTWGAVKLSRWFSTSLRFIGSMTGEISGADPTFNGPVNMNMVPTVFPENFGGTVISTGLGLNFLIPEGPLKDIRVGAEIALPVYRSLNGPQLETDETITIGLQYAF